MKKAIKALAVLLAVCFCFSALIVIVGATNAGEVAKQGSFEFGMYPQSEVKDAALLEQLNALRDKTDRELVKLDGVTYASYRVDGTGCNPGGSPFSFYYGYYPYMKEYKLKTYWFRFEPIKWRVLANDDGVLLLAENVLCTHTFNDAIRADNTWENSDVRTWLNDTFLKTAFTVQERSFLKTSALENEPNLIAGTSSGGAVTPDKVFLPSQSEITNPEYDFNVGWADKVDDFGRPIGYYETDTEEGEHCGRSTGASDYAKCQSVWTHIDKITNKPLDTCFYWLRTAGKDLTKASGVLPDGRVSMTGWDVDYTVLGIRPMMRVAADAVAEGKVSEYVEALASGADPSEIVEPMPFQITPSATEFHFKQEGVKFTADTDVTWDTDNHRIAEIDPETGELTIHRVGTVTIIATSKETGETVKFQMEIEYLWWQELIRIFLFGWIWYK